VNSLSKDSVNWVDVGPEGEGQRVDNFLHRILKGVPKSHVYRILRSGEVRVNSRRAEPTLRLQPGDRVRVPPIRTATPSHTGPVPTGGAALPILYEDDALIAIDKPAGVAVHGGSGISHGVIERLRALRPAAPFLELVHRLDRETSGVLMLAKKRRALTQLHEQIRDGHTDKRYLALVPGAWRKGAVTLDFPLAKHVLDGGDRRVTVSADGQEAATRVRIERTLPDYTLLEARLLTGRTHQIRVHLAHAGFPICGDDKYGDFELNRRLAREGLKRMFLHAARFRCAHPITGEPLDIAAPLPADLERFVLAASGARPPGERP
jgi:23S rRNA pseudouridine955/2504/2580 synthase